MKYCFYLIIVSLALFSCTNEELVITNLADYQNYLDASHFEEKKKNFDEELSFWQSRFDANEGNLVDQQKLAGLHSRAFKLDADANHLLIADSLLQDLHERFPNNVSVLQSLSGVCISQHQFTRAQAYADMAIELGEKEQVSTLMKIDAMLERGQLATADKLLSSLKGEETFDYLIRRMKVQDNQDNLDAAIISMEKAMSQVEASKNKTLMNWSYSNIGDMYGHQGEIAKSYQYYLKALSLDPADLHSLKGIAWIAYSYERDTEKSKQILNFLLEVHPSPEYNLLLAEISDFEGNEELSKMHMMAFLNVATRPAYFSMYRSTIAEIYADSDQPEVALAYAKAETEERPHPTMFALYAYCLKMNDLHEEAAEVVKSWVIDRTGEPAAIMQSAIAVSQSDSQLSELLRDTGIEAYFELGPMSMQRLEAL